MLPQELEKKDGDVVRATEVYQKLIDRYREEFMRFLRDELLLDEVTASDEILARVHIFMHKLDWLLDRDVLPYDSATIEGTERTAEAVFKAFSSSPNGDGTSFQLTEDAATAILEQAPPVNLIMGIRCGDVGRLLEKLDPRDALGMASLTDRQPYLDHVLDFIEKNGTAEWFGVSPMRPVVVSLEWLQDATELRAAAALARLAGRLVVRNTQKGWGGEFPRLWFFLRLIKSIVGIELFSEVWQGFAEDGDEFTSRVVRSVRGHWGRHVLSAHNAFENRHQRILVDRLKRFSDTLSKQPDKAHAARLLRSAADVYHLSITLPDATFVPLSAWTWASHSHRGGSGTPTPLSSLVERDWATRDFLASYIEHAGVGSEETIDKKIVELIGKGREPENLREHVLGVSADPDRLVVLQTYRTAPPMTKPMVRPVDHPILLPVADHAWESRYVLNAAAVRLDGLIYILYRAFGKEEISRIGLAWTKDGIHIDGRLDQPIFEPAEPTEAAGCEDPRVTVIDDQIYMLYTAWDGKLAQIAMASIPVDAFLKRRFDAWVRHGLGFPGLPNKDAVLYPETFDGRYVIYHRLDPNLWISYLDSLTCPWPKTGQKIVAGPRPGMMWDGVKIGAGAPPVKTTGGWLNVYHGVDFERSYRLGVLLTSADDPSKVLYQSVNPVLEPQTDYEIGKVKGGDYWVPHVVFTCGAVPASDTSVVGLNRWRGRGEGARSGSGPGTLERWEVRLVVHCFFAVRGFWGLRRLPVGIDSSLGFWRCLDTG
jgi:predicted GH43/DUF377 family glycosyl hydrolase